MARRSSLAAALALALAAGLAGTAIAADPPAPSATKPPAPKPAAKRDPLDYKAQLPKLEADAQRGDANAAELLGEIYQAGLGVPRDAQRGCDMFERAANTLPEAMHNFANCWYWGIGRPRQPETAAKWYERAIERGFLRSHCALGAQYRHGIGVPEDKAKGFRLCTQGAEQGDPDSLAELGEMYLVGDGIPRDYKKAAEMLRRSAEEGQSNAARLLGIMYFNGDGVPKDPNQARDWLMRAADAGRRDAFLPLGKLFLAATGDLERGPLNANLALPALLWLKLASEYDPVLVRRAEAQKLYDPLAAAAPQLVKQVEPELKPWRTSLGKP